MAEELSGQAVQLSETISFFKLGNESTGPEISRQPGEPAQARKGGTSGNASAGIARAKVAPSAKPKAMPLGAAPKAHTREGIVLNLDDEVAGRVGSDPEDANFKEF